MSRQLTMRVALPLAALALALFVTANTQAQSDVTRPGQSTLGVAATPGSATSAVAVVGTVAGANNYPMNEPPLAAFDDLVGSKYLNFAEINAGLITTGAPAIVNGLRLTTANDRNDRDPILVSLEGTWAANANDAAANAVWTSLYSGPSGLASDPTRQTPGQSITFSNGTPFNTYRFLVTSVRDGVAANSTQFSGLELNGQIIPEPGTLSLLGLAGALFLRRRNR
jgi:hypothetical protein